MASDVADPTLAEAGEARIDWADGQMPVVRSIRERFAREKPLDGLVVGACLHVTSETACLVRTLAAGGADVALCASNPFATQDDVAAALAADGAEVHAVRGDDADAWAARVAAVVARAPQITLDDGADLLSALHLARPDLLDGLLGGTEETTTGLVRLRALQAEGRLACPVLAVNEAITERFNDRFGTGQSAIDGIVRTTNLLLAGRTLVVFGYGWTGKGIALRAHGLGASVIVCEVDPLRALEARMDAFEVLPALAAAERGDVFVTVTGVRDVLRADHFERMKDGAVLANAGHFDVEIDIVALREQADSVREVRPLVEQFTFGGRRLNLLAGGRVVNLAAAEGHPAAVMDISFALQALAAEELARRRPGAGRAPGAGGHRPRGGGAQARIARRDDRRAQPRAGAVPARLGRVTAMDGLQASVEKMRREGLPDAAIDTFTHYYEQLAEGETGMLPESEIEPVEDVQQLDDLPEGDPPLDAAVVLKLNGGLGTSMGMTRAKSLIEAKDGLTFLEVIARQVIELRERSGARLPLVLMDSFYTHDDALEELPDAVSSDVAPDFVQHKEPKILVEDLQPAEWPDDPSLEWCPPGHGDLYTALLTSGMLDDLLDRGYRYAFVSNSDNLGAVLEPRILAWMAREEIPFVMEVTRRTEMDRKGGHIARKPDGGYLLRETAQTPKEDLVGAAGHRPPPVRQHQQPVARPAGAARRHGASARGVLGLPLIVNRKTRRSGRQVDARGLPARDRDGRGDRRVRRGAAGRGLAPALLPGQDDRGSAGAAVGRLRADRRRPASSSPPSATGRRRSSTSTTTTTSCCATSMRASPAARRRWWPANASRSRATSRFGREVVVRGAVTVSGPRQIEDGTVLEG